MQARRVPRFPRFSLGYARIAVHAVLPRGFLVPLPFLLRALEKPFPVATWISTNNFFSPLFTIQVIDRHVAICGTS